ncbi:hypothetical protein BDV98DRAFT_594601 [Pterulicium gracile]|uniref:Uncharacterized protein n=1 Tax=Pterulicium gracile TaxID=1884261 RepID=A0A5C3QHL2_9AGAR|nr:hypothetical protein BDV98DRAFT_594601 [Pterula gracilis]
MIDALPSTSSLFPTSTNTAFYKLEGLITNIVKSASCTQNQILSAIIHYQTRSSGKDTNIPPNAGNSTQILGQTQVDMTVDEKYRLLIDFFAKRFGSCPRDIINAIRSPKTPYDRVSKVLSTLNRVNLETTLSGVYGGWTPNFESHTLFVILPDGSSNDTGDISVGSTFRLDFKSEFIARQVMASMSKWQDQDSLALYSQVRNMGAPAAAFLGWLFEPLSMQNLSRHGGDLYVMLSPSTQSTTFRTQEPPTKATLRLPRFPMARQSFDKILFDTYVLSLSPINPLFDAYLAEKVGRRVIFWILQLTVQRTAHRGSERGYNNIANLKTSVCTKLKITDTDVTVRYVLVKPLPLGAAATDNDVAAYDDSVAASDDSVSASDDNVATPAVLDVGEWKFPEGFQDHRGRVYCSYVDVFLSPVFSQLNHAASDSSYL